MADSEDGCDGGAGDPDDAAEHEEHTRLAQLHAAGLISDEEFESARQHGTAPLPHRGE